MAGAKPNEGHQAIAKLASRHASVALVTQNVDDLHERAGSVGVIHLHGSLFGPRCFACARPHPISDEVDGDAAQAGQLRAPTCGHCGGRVRPGVVWFGEALPQAPWEAARAAVGKADLLVIFGTSAQVRPAPDLPATAHRRGACLVQVNPQSTPLDLICAWNLQTSAAVGLPRVVKLILAEDED